MPTSLRRSPAGDGLFIVGLVGQAGSGKSSVARVFERDGASVIDADRLGHEVVNIDSDVRAALVAEYGADVYSPQGLDRRRVAEVVFRDAEALGRLNRLVHPGIVERIYARLDALRERNVRGVVVVDAALLLDWGFERECDAVIAVTADRPVQLERLRTQRGWSTEDSTRVLEAQRSAEALAAAADVTIDNAGGLEDLERDARAALSRLREGSPD